MTLSTSKTITSALRHRLPALLLLACPILSAQTRHPADLILVNATVVTMDQQRHIVTDGAIAILGDTILAVDTTAAIQQHFSATKIIDAQGALLLPGLINAHTHLSMSLFRGLAEDQPLSDWLTKTIFPAEARNVTADFVTWAARLSFLEMFRGGTTTVADMYYFEDTIAQTAKEAGMRGILGETIIGFPAPDNKTPAAALTYTERFLKHWKNDPLITAAVAPHSIYTCPEQTLIDSAALARKYHAPILIHLSEAPSERDIARHDKGMSTTQYLDKIGLLGPDVLGAHCVWVDQADIHTLATHGVGCSYNPSSNMKTAAGLSPVVDLLAAHVPVGIGTDGAASNNSQDLFEEMDLGAKLQKFGHMDPEVLPAEQVVAMATITGAHALHLDTQIGSLEPGKKADMILIDTSAPHATPMYNVYAEIVYALKSSDVRSTIIAGRLVMEDHKLLTLDEPAILAKAAEYKKQIAASLNPKK